MPLEAKKLISRETLLITPHHLKPTPRGLAPTSFCNAGAKHFASWGVLGCRGLERNGARWSSVVQCNVAQCSVVKCLVVSCKEARSSEVH